MKIQPSKKQKGFTLVELMVSLSLFAIVMVVAIGSMLSIVDGNRKTQSLQVAMNNLNYSLENMNRYIQTGANYSSAGGSTCTAGSLNGSDKLTFKKQFKGDVAYKDVIYERNLHTNGNGGISISIDGSVDEFITAPEIDITDLCFAVVGSGFPGETTEDDLQPAVIISIRGTAESKEKLKSKFQIHSSAVQRDVEGFDGI